jgi:hypothetical protein
MWEHWVHYTTRKETEINICVLKFKPEFKSLNCRGFFFKILLNKRADFTCGGSVYPVSVNFNLEVAYVGGIKHTVRL